MVKRKGQVTGELVVGHWLVLWSSVETWNGHLMVWHTGGWVEVVVWNRRMIGMGGLCLGVILFMKHISNFFQEKPSSIFQKRRDNLGCCTHGLRRITGHGNSSQVLSYRRDMESPAAFPDFQNLYDQVQMLRCSLSIGVRCGRFSKRCASWSIDTPMYSREGTVFIPFDYGRLGWATVPSLS